MKRRGEKVQGIQAGDPESEKEKKENE